MKALASWFFVLAAGTALATGAARAASDAGSPAQKLYQSRCSACHSLDRPEKKNKDRVGWERTVSRMRGYSPGQLSENEATAILEYLVRTRAPKD